MKVLQLTAHFRPNIGGVETHLNDLVKALIKRDWDVVVLTYQPLTTKTSWKVYEQDKNLIIFRIPWLAGFFYKFVSHPMVEFLYLMPGLFLAFPCILVWKKPDVVHAHGLVAGFVGVFWGKIFRKRVIISTHSIYSFPKAGLYRAFASWILSSADYCLAISKKATAEIVSLINFPDKVSTFTYWIDLKNFQKDKEAKNKLGWKGEFVIIFVGRLVKEKGVDMLLKAAKIWDKKIKLKIVGVGPMEELVKLEEKKLKNLQYLGAITQDKLPIFFSGSDILIVPSASEEGFGRVIIESLSCGTPVLGSKRGSISEAINETVGRLIDAAPKNIKSNVEYFYKNQDKLRKLAENCRKYAERRYSEKNVEEIIRSYKG